MRCAQITVLEAMRPIEFFSVIRSEVLFTPMSPAVGVLCSCVKTSFLIFFGRTSCGTTRLLEGLSQSRCKTLLISFKLFHCVQQCLVVGEQEDADHHLALLFDFSFHSRIGLRSESNLGYSNTDPCQLW